MASSGTTAKHPERCNIPMSLLAWLGLFLGAGLVPGSFIQARANVFVLGGGKKNLFVIHLHLVKWN